MDHTRIAAVIAGTIGLLFGATAFAQDDGVIYEEESSFDFDDDIVEGQLIRPDGELIGGQRHGKESRLINIRADFIPEMVRSVEEL